MMEITIGMLPTDPKHMGKSDKAGDRTKRSLTEARKCLADAIDLYEGDFEGQEQRFYALLKDCAMYLDEHAAAMGDKGAKKDTPPEETEDTEDDSESEDY
jgi:hypothetical protein